MDCMYLQKSNSYINSISIAVVLILSSAIFVMPFSLDPKNAGDYISSDNIIASPYNADLKGELVWDVHNAYENDSWRKLIYVDKTLVVKSREQIVALNSTNGETIWKVKVPSRSSFVSNSLVPCSIGIFTILNDGSTDSDLPHCSAAIINQQSRDIKQIKFAILERCNALELKFACEINDGLLIGVDRVEGMNSHNGSTEVYFIEYAKIRDETYSANDGIHIAAENWCSNSNMSDYMSVNNDKSYFASISDGMITLVSLKNASHTANQLPFNYSRSVMCDSSGNLVILRNSFTKYNEKRLNKLRVKDNFPRDRKIVDKIMRLEENAKPMIEMYSPDLKKNGTKRINVPAEVRAQLIQISDREYCLCLDDRILWMNGLKCKKKIKIPGETDLSQMIILKDNSFLFASGKTLYHISTSGKITDKFTHDKSFTGRPVVDEEGAVYCTTEKGLIKIR